MDERSLSELTDEELIREAKLLYEWLSSGEVAYTMDDLHRLEKIIEELEWVKGELSRMLGWVRARL
jgi:hypothetical protein